MSLRHLVTVVLAALAACADPSPDRPDAGGPDGYPDANNSQFDSCIEWSSLATSESLQEAVDREACVRIAAGAHDIREPIVLPRGHRLTGHGRELSTLRVSEQWSFGCCDAMVVPGLNGEIGVATVDNLTLFGNGLASYGVGTAYLEITDVEISMARCAAVAIAGPEVTVRNSRLSYSAQHTVHGGERVGCESYVGPLGVMRVTEEGAAIYGVCPHDPQIGYVSARFAPVIEGNTIVGTLGPAIDMNGIWDGTLRDNIIEDNSSWAAVSLYASSHWLIEGNQIDHPLGQPGNPFSDHLIGGPLGGAGAGLYFGQDTDTGGMITTNNTVRYNHIVGDYGVLSIGWDDDGGQPDWAPRNHWFEGNDMTGSTLGCADDFLPGQWMTDSNTWVSNTCTAMSANTPPTFF